MTCTHFSLHTATTHMYHYTCPSPTIENCSITQTCIKSGTGDIPVVLALSCRWGFIVCSWYFCAESPLKDSKLSPKWIFLNNNTNYSELVHVWDYCTCFSHTTWTLQVSCAPCTNCTEKCYSLVDGHLLFNITAVPWTLNSRVSCREMCISTRTIAIQENKKQPIIAHTPHCTLLTWTACCQLLYSTLCY